MANISTNNSKFEADPGTPICRRAECYFLIKTQKAL